MKRSVLNNFNASDFATRSSGYGLGRLRNLGAVSETSAEASIDVAVAVGQTRVLMALATELAKIDNAKYQERAQHVQHLIEAVAELNQQIPTLTPSNIAPWRASLDHIDREMGNLEQQLHADLESGRGRRDVLAVAATAGAVLLAGGAAWYVFSKRRKKQFA